MRICPKCGRENSNNSERCKGCGEILIRRKKTKPDKRNPVMLIVGIIAFFLIAGGGMLYLGRSSDSNSGFEDTPVDTFIEDYRITYCPGEEVYGKLELVGIEDAWWIPDRVTIINQKGEKIENYPKERISVESSDESVLSVEMDMDREQIIFIPKKIGKADITISYTQEDGKQIWDTQTITIFSSILLTSEYSADGEENIVIHPNESVTWHGEFHYPTEKPFEYISAFEDRTIGLTYSNWNLTDIDDRTMGISVELDDVLGEGEGSLCIVAFSENSSGDYYPVIIKKLFISIQ